LPHCTIPTFSFNHAIRLSPVPRWLSPFLVSTGDDSFDLLRPDRERCLQRIPLQAVTTPALHFRFGNLFALTIEGDNGIRNARQYGSSGFEAPPLRRYEMRRFQSFRLDTSNKCLWNGEDRADIAPKALDVLRYLVERAGQLVTPDEILEALWPGTYVNPEGLRKYIQEIRKVLGDRPNKPIFITTVHQFIASVLDESSAKPLDLPTEAAKKIVGREVALADLDRCLRKAVSSVRSKSYSSSIPPQPSSSTVGD